MTTSEGWKLMDRPNKKNENKNLVKNRGHLPAQEDKRLQSKYPPGPEKNEKKEKNGKKKEKKKKKKKKNVWQLGTTMAEQQFGIKRKRRIN